jgi:hypothetical protein
VSTVVGSTVRYLTGSVVVIVTLMDMNLFSPRASTPEMKSGEYTRRSCKSFWLIIEDIDLNVWMRNDDDVMMQMMDNNNLQSR